MNMQVFGYNMKNLGLLRQQIKNTYTFKAKFQNFLVMKIMKMFLWKTIVCDDCDMMIADMMCKNEREFQKYPLKDYLLLSLKKTANSKKPQKKSFE
jgi:hypothetical protein